jgi:hypothetical protein
VFSYFVRSLSLRRFASGTVKAASAGTAYIAAVDGAAANATFPGEPRDGHGKAAKRGSPRTIFSDKCNFPPTGFPTLSDGAGDTEFTQRLFRDAARARRQSQGQLATVLSRCTIGAA